MRKLVVSASFSPPSGLYPIEFLALEDVVHDASGVVVISSGRHKTGVVGVWLKSIGKALKVIAGHVRE